LQVSTISQALIFITRSRGFFFTERPSVILVVAFIIAQLVATFISVYANWGFTNIAGCGWGWAAIVWVWNVIWFFPLDLVKFALRAYFDPIQKRNVEELMSNVSSTPEQQNRRKSTIAGSGPPSRRSTVVGPDKSSRRGTLATAAKYYEPHTRALSTSHGHRNFSRMLKIDGIDASRAQLDKNELRRFSIVQAHHASKLLGAHSGGGGGDRQTTVVTSV